MKTAAATTGADRVTRARGAPFDLLGLIRDVCRNAGTVTDPAQLAKEVHRRVPKAAYGEALASALRRIVAWELNNSQRAMQIVRPSAALEAPDGTGRPKPSARSPYVEGLRAEAAHTKYLRTLFKVDDDPTHRLPYGKCGRTELDYIITYRRKVAAANTAEADAHQYMRELLDQHEVDRVEQLPEEVLAATLLPRDG